MQAFEIFVREKDWEQTMASQQYHATLRRQKTAAYSQQPGKASKALQSRHPPHSRAGSDRINACTAEGTAAEAHGAPGLRLPGRARMTSHLTSADGEKDAAGSCQCGQNSKHPGSAMQVDLHAGPGSGAFAAKQASQHAGLLGSSLQRLWNFSSSYPVCNTQPDPLWPAHAEADDGSGSQSEGANSDDGTPSGVSEEAPGDADAAAAYPVQDDAGRESTRLAYRPHSFTALQHRKASLP